MENKTKIKVYLKVTDAAKERINSIMTETNTKRIEYDVTSFEHNYLVLRFWDKPKGGDVVHIYPVIFNQKEFTKLTLDYNQKEFSVAAE